MADWHSDMPSFRAGGLIDSRANSRSRECIIHDLFRIIGFDLFQFRILSLAGELCGTDMASYSFWTKLAR